MIPSASVSPMIHHHDEDDLLPSPGMGHSPTTPTRRLPEDGSTTLQPNHVPSQPPLMIRSSSSSGRDGSLVDDATLRAAPPIPLPPSPNTASPHQVPMLKLRPRPSSTSPLQSLYHHRTPIYRYSNSNSTTISTRSNAAVERNHRHPEDRRFQPVNRKNIRFYDLVDWEVEQLENNNSCMAPLLPTMSANAKPPTLHQRPSTQPFRALWVNTNKDY